LLRPTRVIASRNCWGCDGATWIGRLGESASQTPTCAASTLERVSRTSARGALCQLPDRLCEAVLAWHERSHYGYDEDLVFTHPVLGTPLDRTNLTRRFQQARRDAGGPVIPFHYLRHTFGMRLAAAGVPLRAIHGFLGHAYVKTTQIYAHYAPSEREVDLINEAFRRRLD
jgi:integrase